MDAEFVKTEFKRKKSIREYYEKELGLHENIVNDIENNPHDYGMLICTFNIENKSRNFRAFNIKIEPQFEEEFKKLVLWYDKNLGVAPIAIRPDDQVRGVNLLIFIKNEGHTENEIINMVKESKFKVSGLTGKSIFSIGYDSIVVEYQY